MTRKMIETYIPLPDDDLIEEGSPKTLQSVLEKVQEYITVYGPEATLDISPGGSGFGHCVIQFREENDSEMNFRLAREKKLEEDRVAWEKSREDRDRRTYEELKKRFEGT